MNKKYIPVEILRIPRGNDKIPGQTHENKKKSTVTDKKPAELNYHKHKPEMKKNMHVRTFRSIEKIKEQVRSYL